MITNDVSTCPKCGGDLKYYDRVTRIVRTKGRKTWKIPMRRLQCTRCGSVHRELPELIFPYKQYEAEVIIGVLEGFITCETIGFEEFGRAGRYAVPFQCRLDEYDTPNRTERHRPPTVQCEHQFLRSSNHGCEENYFGSKSHRSFRNSSGNSRGSVPASSYNR